MGKLRTNLERVLVPHATLAGMSKPDFVRTLRSNRERYYTNPKFNPVIHGSPLSALMAEFYYLTQVNSTIAKSALIDLVNKTTEIVKANKHQLFTVKRVTNAKIADKVVKIVNAAIVPTGEKPRVAQCALYTDVVCVVEDMVELEGNLYSRAAADKLFYTCAATGNRFREDSEPSVETQFGRISLSAAKVTLVEEEGGKKSYRTAKDGWLRYVPEIDKFLLCGTPPVAPAGVTALPTGDHLVGPHLANARAVGTSLSYSTDANGECHNKFLTDIYENHSRRGDTLFMGVELETNVRREFQTDMASVIRESYRAFSTDNGDCMAIGKVDGSIGSTGVEWVTVPATRKMHEKVIWSKFFDEKGPHNKYWAYRTGKCGMHVHVNLSFFNELELAKLASFIQNDANKVFLSHIAQRDVDKLASWCKTADAKGTADALKKMKRGEMAGHGTALNIHPRGDRSRPTAEFRIFRANLKPDSFFRNLEFVEAACYFSKQASISAAPSWKEFCAWLSQPHNRSVYSRLYLFLCAHKFIEPYKNSLKLLIDEEDGSAYDGKYKTAKREYLASVPMVTVKFSMSGFGTGFGRSLSDTLLEGLVLLDRYVLPNGVIYEAYTKPNIDFMDTGYTHRYTSTSAMLYTVQAYEGQVRYRVEGKTFMQAVMFNPGTHTSPAMSVEPTIGSYISVFPIDMTAAVDISVRDRLARCRNVLNVARHNAAQLNTWARSDIDAMGTWDTIEAYIGHSSGSNEYWNRYLNGYPWGTPLSVPYAAAPVAASEATIVIHDDLAEVAF